MKKTYLLVLTIFTLFSCTDDINNIATEDSERIGIGAYQISEASKGFLPYFGASNIVMVAENDDEFIFQISGGAVALEQSFSRKFPHPNDFDRDVIYDFSGERVEFELLNIDLGVKFEVILRSDICSNPNLEKEGQVKDHLQIEARGFRSPEDPVSIPTLIDIVVEEKNICKEDGFSGIFIGEVTLINKTFFEVFHRRVTFGENTAEIFYNAEFGIIGFKVDDIFWELKEVN